MSTPIIPREVSPAEWVDHCATFPSISHSGLKKDGADVMFQKFNGEVVAYVQYDEVKKYYVTRDAFTP